LKKRPQGPYRNWRRSGKGYRDYTYDYMGLKMSQKDMRTRLKVSTEVGEGLERVTGTTYIRLYMGQKMSEK
jgi:hypothetical protein